MLRCYAGGDLQVPFLLFIANNYTFIRDIKLSLRKGVVMSEEYEVPVNTDENNEKIVEKKTSFFDEKHYIP